MGWEHDRKPRYFSESQGRLKNPTRVFFYYLLLYFTFYYLKVARKRFRLVAPAPFLGFPAVG